MGCSLAGFKLPEWGSLYGQGLNKACALSTTESRVSQDEHSRSSNLLRELLLDTHGHRVIEVWELWS
jgi:hypothetical protein